MLHESILFQHEIMSEFRYIDDVLSLNNARFGDYLHFIYPKGILQIHPHLLLTLTCILKLTPGVNLEPNFLTSEIVSIFQSSIFPFWVVIFQQLQLMAFTFHNLFASLEPVTDTVTFLIESDNLPANCSDRVLLTPDWNFHYRSSMAYTTSWLIVTISPFRKWNWIFSRNRSFASYRIWPWATRRVTI